MADYVLTQTGDEVQDILDSALKVTGDGATLTQTGEEVQSILDSIVGGDVVLTDGMTPIPANADLNNYKTVGTYNIVRNADVSTLSNCPTTRAFKMVVDTTLGDGNYTQTITTYDGAVYVRTYQAYDSTWIAWVRVGKAFTTRLATVTVGKNLGSYVSLSAPSVSGYTFLCWIGSATTGWVGGTYIESMNSASTRAWVCASTESSGTGDVNAWALYVEN